MFGSCSVMHYVLSIASIIMGKRWLVFFLMSCGCQCSVALPHDAMV